MSFNLIDLKDVSKYYHKQDNVTLGLRKINLSLNKGEFVAVVGESGSGKSTLMNVISGVDTYEEGEMYYMGEETSCYTKNEWDAYRKDNISFIYQDYNLIDSYTILQNVELAFIDSNLDKKERRIKALKLIEQVGLSGHIKHRCTKLSGGQKQRVAIARALAKDTPILIADEPTGNLDETTAKAIIKLLAEVSRDKLLVMVTHSFEDVADFATRRVRIFDGEIVEDKEIKLIESKDCKECNTVDAKPDNIINIKSKLRNIGNNFKMAMNNTIATPKKSAFMFFSTFAATLILLTYLMICINPCTQSPEINSDGDRFDTAVIFKSDRAEFTEATRTELLNIDGVEAVMMKTFSNAMYSDNVLKDNITYSCRILNVACFNSGIIKYGRLPVNDNEILIGMDAYGTPDTDMLEKEALFYYSYYDYNESEERIKVEKTYTIVGFAPSSYSYMTTGGIENIVTEDSPADSKNYNINITDYSYTTLAGSNFNLYDIVFDSNIEWGEAVLIYDENEAYTSSQNLYGIYNYIKDYSDELFGNFTYNNATMYDYKFDITVSTQDINPEFYNTLYKGNIVLAVNPFYSQLNAANIGKVNSATVIFNENYLSGTVISNIESAGYKVIYNYNKIEAEYSVRYTFETQLLMSFIGLAIIILVIALMSLVFNRVLKSKKKDYNIFRTLGFSTNNIKLLVFFEILIINAAAYVSLVVLLIASYYIAMSSMSIGVIYTLLSLIPYGLFHYTMLRIYLIAFLVILTESIIISRVFNKKLFNNSIKSSAVNN